MEKKLINEFVNLISIFKTGQSLLGRTPVVWNILTLSIFVGIFTNLLTDANKVLDLWHRADEIVKYWNETY